MSAAVQTVRGAISPADLGSVLMHEHVFIITQDYLLNYPEREGFDEGAHVDAAVKSLNELKFAGVGTIVDLTVFGMGRFIPRIQRVAEQTDVNIVVATGMYIYESLPMPFHFQGPGTVLGGPEVLVDMFVGDIEEGIAGTGVRAGIIKCATDEAGMTPQVERVVRAAARTQVQTGAPISTHTHAASRVGLAQVRIFQEEGVDLSRTIIGHSGDTDDIDYLTALLATGVTLGMDRFGVDSPLTTEQRVAVVAELCAQGFSDQLVLSHDTAIFNDFTPAETVRKFAPDWNYFFITTRVLPLLRERGVAEQAITAMLVDNPARLLSFDR